MGNQQSKPPSRTGTQHEKDDKHHRNDKDKEREKDSEKEKDRGQRVGRRISMQGLSHGHWKGPAADPSASKESALGQTISQPSSQRQDLQHHLQTAHSHSPEQDEDPHSNNNRQVSSPNADQDSRDLEYRTKRPSQFTGIGAEPSIPVDVPGSVGKPARGTTVGSAKGSYETSSLPPGPTYAAGPLKRPPRLPLAIADELHAPESPPLPPTAVPGQQDSIFDHEDEETELRRPSSMLSSVTQDEDEDDSSELHAYAVDTGTANVVPTKVDWNGGGEKVYVTGTFANWDKKYRLNPRTDGPGMTATITIPPGTHHLKFIVDNEMVTSTELPTTVDIHNILVNYIEVVAAEPTRGRRESSQRPRQIPRDYFPPKMLPEEDEYGSDDSGEMDGEPMELPEEEVLVGDFRQLMPQPLLDMELSESDVKFRQAYRIINDTPGPPGLPLFLAKSILNGILPNKDDNSVLTLPNHTVLNHLATSSIKNKVLATSVTTRYKKKYVTTIMYKPTAEPK